MSKAKLNKPNRISNRVPRMQKRELKKPSCQKSHWPNKPNKRFNQWQEQILREKPRMLNTTLNKEPKMLQKASKRQPDMKEQPCNRLNKTSPKDGKRLNRVLPMHIPIQRINWVMPGVISSKRQDRKLNKQAKLWNKKVMLCRKTLDFDEYYNFKHFPNLLYFSLFSIYKKWLKFAFNWVLKNCIKFKNYKDCALSYFSAYCIWRFNGKFFWVR